uniref:MAT1 domain-containing protein n=1 Tax=Heterorhabditis bacteriophora TaxID=37862 RepID=A0A1I7XTW4_HETBA
MFLYRNCVDNLFARNAAPCHVCGKTLRKNNFWEQVFDDPLIEKETHIRRRLRKIYNLKKEDFLTLREYNDYLERVETLVVNLAYGIDLEETEAEIATFKEANSELIERNKKKLDEDQLWIMQNLKEDRNMKNRLDEVHNQENKEIERSAVKDTKAIMEELRQSNVPAEVILDRERKRQIEQELEEKEEAARRKRRNKELLQDRKRQAESMSFSTTQRVAGRAFEYQPLRLNVNGPPLPEKDELDVKGYLQHIRAASQVIYYEFVSLFMVNVKVLFFNSRFVSPEDLQAIRDVSAPFLRAESIYYHFKQDIKAHIVTTFGLTFDVLFTVILELIKCFKLVTSKRDYML